MVRQRMDLGKIDAALAEIKEDQEKKHEDTAKVLENMKEMLEARDERIVEMEHQMKDLKHQVEELKKQMEDLKKQQEECDPPSTPARARALEEPDRELSPNTSPEHMKVDKDDKEEDKEDDKEEDKEENMEDSTTTNNNEDEDEGKDENDSIEEEEKKEPRGKDPEEEDNGQEFKEQKRKKKKNKKAKKDEDQFMAGKEKLKGEIEIRAEEGGTGRRVSLDDLYEMMKKYKLTSREFKAAIHTKMQELEGRCVDARCVDGVTKDVEDFLSEFGQEFERYLKDEIKNARKEQ